MEALKASMKRILALLLLAMVLSAIPCVALAANGGVPADDAVINFSAIGSITVTKYATTSANTGANPAGTGLKDQQPSSIYRTMEGVSFKLFQIANADEVMAYYNGKSISTYSLEQFSYNYDTETATYADTPIADANIRTGKTDANGTCKFDNLPVGIYVLKEVTAPDQITPPLSEDSLISIPMVNAATSNNNGNAKWMYDVFVYPKNKATTGTVKLTKVDQTNGDTPLENVTFELYRKDFNDNLTLPNTEWTKVQPADLNEEGQSLTLKTDAEGKLTMVNLPAGENGTQYKLVEVSAPAGYIVNQTPLYFKVNRDFTLSWNGETGDPNGCNNENKAVIGTDTSVRNQLAITLGNERPSLTKDVKANGGENWKQDEQYRMGAPITYKLTVVVPSNVAQLDQFVISDSAAPGITYMDGINISNGTVTLQSGFTREFAGDRRSFTLTFAKTDDVMTAIAGKKLTITYDAYMNGDAVIAGSGNGNTATLTYSKYIGKPDDNSTYAITDEARVYTYQYMITKELKDAATQTQAGAGVEFQLLDSDQTTLIKVVALNIVDGVDQGGSYRLAITGETGIDTMKTGADGTLTVKGLENGTYYLKETKTLAGYNLLSEPFKITVDVQETTTWNTDGTFTASGKVVKTYGNNTTYSPENAMGSSTIINKKGFVLPQTGGMGYLLFCAVGIALIAGGAALIFGGRKKKIR